MYSRAVSRCTVGLSVDVHVHAVGLSVDVQ